MVATRTAVPGLLLFVCVVAVGVAAFILFVLYGPVPVRRSVVIAPRITPPAIRSTVVGSLAAQGQTLFSTGRPTFDVMIDAPGDSMPVSVFATPVEPFAVAIEPAYEAKTSRAAPPPPPQHASRPMPRTPPPLPPVEESTTSRAKKSKPADETPSRAKRSNAPFVAPPPKPKAVASINHAFKPVVRSREDISPLPRTRSARGTGAPDRYDDTFDSARTAPSPVVDRTDPVNLFDSDELTTVEELS